MLLYLTLHRSFAGSFQLYFGSIQISFGTTVEVSGRKDTNNNSRDAEEDADPVNEPQGLCDHSNVSSGASASRYRISYSEMIPSPRNTNLPFDHACVTEVGRGRRHR